MIARPGCWELPSPIGFVGRGIGVELARRGHISAARVGEGRKRTRAPFRRVTVAELLKEWGQPRGASLEASRVLMVVGRRLYSRTPEGHERISRTVALRAASGGDVEELVAGVRPSQATLAAFRGYGFDLRPVGPSKGAACRYRLVRSE